MYQRSEFFARSKYREILILLKTIDYDKLSLDRLQDKEIV